MTPKPSLTPSSSTTIDLRPSWVRLVRGILRQHVPEAEVRAFGSRVTGGAKSYSDLDLVIVGQQPLSLRSLGQLQEAFQESDLPIRVEVVDWHALETGFQSVIARCYVLMQRGGEG